MKCRVCEKEIKRYAGYCDEHYLCRDCGTKEDLISDTNYLLCPTCRKLLMKKRVAEFFGSDTTDTDEVICPHCGYKEDNSWEMQNDRYDCDDCGGAFLLERDITVTYTTTAMDAEEPTA